MGFRCSFFDGPLRCGGATFCRTSYDVVEFVVLFQPILYLTASVFSDSFLVILLVVGQLFWQALPFTLSQWDVQKKHLLVQRL